MIKGEMHKLLQAFKWNVAFTGGQVLCVVLIALWTHKTFWLDLSLFLNAFIIFCLLVSGISLCILTDFLLDKGRFLPISLYEDPSHIFTMLLGLVMLKFDVGKGNFYPQDYSVYWLFINLTLILGIYLFLNLVLYGCYLLSDESKKAK